VVAGLTDLTLAGQEDQDVTRRGAPEFVHRVGNGVVQVEVAPFFKWPPALFHREHAPRHHDHRRRPLRPGKVLRKAVRIDGGRGHDDLQIRPLPQNLPQMPKQEIDVQAAFVRLVDDQRVIGAQQRVGLRFGQQDAVGHQLDAGAGLQAVLKAHLESHHLAQWRIQLLRNALGHAAGRDAPRLRVADQSLAARAQAAAEFQHDLGQLCRLA
jgi:hypothetical protein